MNSGYRHYVILVEDDYAYLSGGANPCDAVKNHYDRLDSWCSPGEEVIGEEFTVTVASIPERLEDQLSEELEDLDSEDMAAALEQLRSDHKDTVTTTVNVVYTAEGVSVSTTAP